MLTATELVSLLVMFLQFGQVLFTVDEQIRDAEMLEMFLCHIVIIKTEFKVLKRGTELMSDYKVLRDQLKEETMRPRELT